MAVRRECGVRHQSEKEDTRRPGIANSLCSRPQSQPELYLHYHHQLLIVLLLDVDHDQYIALRFKLINTE